MRRRVGAWVLAVGLLVGCSPELVLDDSPRMQEATLQPDMAPPLDVVDAAGEPLAPLRGLERPLLVHFWASWCSTCRAEMPLLAGTYAAGRADILLVNVDDPVGSAEGLLAELGVGDLPSAYAEHSDLAGWPIFSVPSSFLVSPEGKILGQRFGPLYEGDPLLAQ